MKSLLFALAGILLALPPFFTMAPALAVAAEPSWVLADENPETRFYYDSKGVTMPTKGISRVPIRVVYTDKGKADALATLGHAPAFEKLLESRYGYDIDCRKRSIHLLQVTHLDEDGNQIKSVDLAGITEWEEIPPGSRLDLLADEVCTKANPGK